MAYPKTSFALTCGAPSVEGGMSTCSGGLNITFNPAQPQIGTQTSISVSLKDSSDAAFFKDQGATLQVFVVTPGMIWDSTNQIYQQDFRGSSVQGSFLVGGQYIPKAGSYSIRAEVSYQANTGPSVTNYSFSQDTQLTVQAGSSTGGPSLTVTASESYADGPNINKGISWVYQDGGSGKQVASYKVDCGDGKGTLAVPSGQTSFRCTYTNTAKDYTATVYAYDAAGGQVLSQNITNSVTGLEQTQGAGSSSTTPDDGGVLWGLISKVVGFVLGIIQEIIYAIFYLLIVPIIQAVLSIHVYTDTFVSVIYPGWIVLRNLCNIIFIVAIMAIAIGTLLRVDSYKSRSVLVQLILAALLVNFSLVIAQIVLGIADTVQSQFLPNNQEVIRALGKDLMVAYRSDVFNLKITGYFSDIVKQFMFLILACGSFMVFLAIAAFLFIRMIMLWILLMLSPLAYAAGALPSTAHYRSEWWTTFLKYAFFTPIMAFFLNMTAIVSNTYKQNSIFGSLGVSNTDFGSNDLSAFIFRTGSTLLLIVFLIVALKVAESFSIFGAGEISKFAKGGMFLPVVGAKALGGKAAQTYSKWTNKKMTAAEEAGKTKTANAWRAAQFLNFKVAKKAWEERAHEKELEAYEPSVGSVRDSIGRIIPTEWTRDKHGPWYKRRFHLGQKTFYGRIKQQQMISQKEREWDNADLSEEEKVEAWIAAHHPEDKEAIERLLIKGRHEDGRSIALGMIARKKFEQETYKQLRANNVPEGEARAKAQALAEEIPAEYDAVDDLDNVTEGLEHAGLNSEQRGRIVAHLDELGEADRKLRAIGNAVHEFDGKFRTANDFSGYEKMEKAMGSAEMLKDLAGLHDVFEEPQLGTDYDEVEVMVDDGHGNQVAKKTKVFKQLRFKDGNGHISEIKSYADLDSVSKATNVADWKEKGGNLRYEMTGARKQGSAQKRVDRGDSEAWGSALEPAAFLVQDEKGEFNRFTSFGRRLFQQYSQANINSLKKGRKIQARVLKAIGLYKDQNGDLSIEKTKFNVMAEGFELNEDFSEALLMKADLEKEQAGQIRDRVGDEMVKRLSEGISSLPVEKLNMVDAQNQPIKTLDELRRYCGTDTTSAEWGKVKKAIIGEKVTTQPDPSKPPVTTWKKGIIVIPEKSEKP